MSVCPIMQPSGSSHDGPVSQAPLQWGVVGMWTWPHSMHASKQLQDCSAVKDTGPILQGQHVPLLSMCAPAPVWIKVVQSTREHSSLSYAQMEGELPLLSYVCGGIKLSKGLIGYQEIVPVTSIRLHNYLSKEMFGTPLLQTFKTRLDKDLENSLKGTAVGQLTSPPVKKKG